MPWIPPLNFSNLQSPHLSIRSIFFVIFQSSNEFSFFYPSFVNKRFHLFKARSNYSLLYLLNVYYFHWLVLLRAKYAKHHSNIFLLRAEEETDKGSRRISSISRLEDIKINKTRRTRVITRSTRTIIVELTLELGSRLEQTPRFFPRSGFITVSQKSGGNFCCVPRGGHLPFSVEEEAVSLTRRHDPGARRRTV